MSLKVLIPLSHGRSYEGGHKERRSPCRKVEQENSSSDKKHEPRTYKEYRAMREAMEKKKEKM